MKTNKQTNNSTKKLIISSILILAITIMISANVSAVTIFSDNFLDNNLYNNGWTLDHFKAPFSGGPYAGTSTVWSYDGTPYAWVDDGGAIYKSINTTDIQNLTFSYCRRTGSLIGPSEHLKIGWKTGSYSSTWSQWTQLEQVNTNSWSCVSFDLPASAENTTLYIAFFSDTSFWDYGYIDNVDVSGTPLCIDNDNDTYCDISFYGDDCNDNNASIHPNAPETICNGIDYNCNGFPDDDVYNNNTWPQDHLNSNQKGVCEGSGQICMGTEGWKDFYLFTQNWENNTEVTCDNLDNDCDGLVDEDLTQNLGELGECASNTNTCSEGNWNPTIGNYVPVNETCNGLDDNCDGTTDENLTAPAANKQEGVCSGTTKICSGTNGWTEPNYSLITNYETTETSCDNLDNDCDGTIDNFTQAANNTEGECANNTNTCSEGNWNPTTGNYVPINETCNGLDDNCDGIVDNGLTAPSLSNQNGVCETYNQTCEGTNGWNENYSIVPNYETTETSCDNLDNDCDGTIDNFTQAANNTEGECASNTNTCSEGNWNPTEGNYVPAEEICDNLDNDCDGSTDEDLTQTTTCGVGVCSDNTGMETCSAGVWSGDTCNPLAGASTEICDNQDNDCDGSTDEELTQNLGELGECASNTNTCSEGNWNPTTGNYVPADEICDNKDNDCDGTVDENLTQTTNCGVGVCSDNTGMETCSAGVWSGDTCNPLAGASTEICDNLDNDCDGTTDEDLTQAASNTEGECASNTNTCSEGNWNPTTGNYIPTNEICDNKDNDCDGSTDENLIQSASNVEGECSGNTNTCSEGNWNPTTGNYIPVNETCNGLDDNCDGSTDEELTAPLTSKQEGVCSGTTKVCDGTSGWNDDYSMVTNYETTETSCDGLDNDCDGTTDEDCSVCTVSPRADLDGDGIISTTELLAYIQRWKLGEVSTDNLSQIKAFWEAGVGC